MSRRKSDFWHVFAAPTLMAVLSLVGLVAALVGDGAWDGVSWLTLGIPVAVMGWYMVRPARRS